MARNVSAWLPRMVRTPIAADSTIAQHVERAADTSQAARPSDARPPITIGARKAQLIPSRKDNGTATSAASEPSRLERKNSRLSASRGGSPSSPVNQATVAPLVKV